MGYIEWTAALGVGIPAIDSQHRQLVDIINRLAAAANAKAATEELDSILGELEDYGRYHFSLEEEAFAKVSYPGTSAHVAEHRAFLARLAGFEASFRPGRAEVGEEILSYLRTWLTRHISFSDKKYKPFLSEIM